jgi:excisionase family DNA binding protein
MSAHDLRPPSDATSRQAAAAVRALRGAARSRRPAVVRVEPEGDPAAAVAVPAEAFELLLRVLAHLANGDAVTIVPVHTEVTTQQAADLLNVSRPHLIKLLDEGKIPFRKVGTHRRVPLRDLLEFKRRDDAERKAVADELSAEAQRLGLDY